jgi:hypothetical protein
MRRHPAPRRRWAPRSCSFVVSEPRLAHLLVVPSGSEAQQRAVQTGLAFPADAESAEVVQPGKRTLDNPPRAPEPRTVLGGAPRDHRLHAAAPQFAAVLIVVVTAIGNHLAGAPARSPAFARDGTDPIDERQELRHVVAISAGQRCGQRHAVTVDDQVVLGAGAGAVNRRRPAQAPLEERGCGLSQRPHASSRSGWRYSGGGEIRGAVAPIPMRVATP